MHTRANTRARMLVSCAGATWSRRFVDVEQKVCQPSAAWQCPVSVYVCKFKVRRCAESAKILFPFLFWRACVTVVVGNSGQKRGQAVVRNMVKQS